MKSHTSTHCGPIFNQPCCHCCCHCCVICLLLLGQRASACTFEHLFVRMASLCWGVCFSFVVCCLSKHFSAVHSVVILCAEDICLFIFKLLLKFRNVLTQTDSRSSLACNQNIKESIPTALVVFLYFETKRKVASFM